MTENSNSAGIQSLNSSSAPSITWLTLKEACDFLGVHYTTLRSWADKGEISVFRTPGGHRRPSRSDRQNSSLCAVCIRFSDVDQRHGAFITVGVTPIVFGGSGAALPVDFFAFTSRMMHGFIAPALLLLVVLHVGAALYHQFLLKDNLLARMWYGK